MKKSKSDAWNALPKNIRTKIVDSLDKVSKFNLSLCSRRTYNNIAGKCDYFHKLTIKQIYDSNNRREYYLIQMFYKHTEKEIKENSKDSDSDDDFNKEDKPEHYIEVDTHIECPSDENGSRVKRKTVNTRTIVGGEACQKGDLMESHTYGGGDPQTVAFRHFWRLLKKNHRFLGAIDMDVTFMKPTAFDMKTLAAGIGKFTNLEYLRLYSIQNVKFFIPRLSKKLKVLNLSCFDARMNNKQLRFVMNAPHFYGISDYLAIKHTDILYEEIIRLKAKRIEFALDSMSDRNLNQFVHSWVNGGIHQKLELCVLEWAITKTEVDVNTVLNGLDVIEIGEENFNFGGERAIHGSDALKFFFGVKLKNPKIYRIRSKLDGKIYMDIIFAERKLVFSVRNDKVSVDDNCDMAMEH